MHVAQDARQSIIHAYVSKALNAEEKRREAHAAGRAELPALWHKAAIYAWSLAEFGTITAADAVNGEYDRRILDKRCLAGVTGDVESVNDGEWCEKHELILGGVLDSLTLAEVRLGIPHFAAGLTAEEIGHELGFYTRGVAQVLESVRVKGRNLVQGESSPPPRYHLTPRDKHKTDGMRSKRIAPTVSALLPGPMTTEQVAGLLDGRLKTARRLLKVLETNGYASGAQTEVCKPGRPLRMLWQLTDKGKRFAEELTGIVTDHEQGEPNVAVVDPVPVVESPVVTVAAVQSTPEGKGEEIVPKGAPKPNHADRVLTALRQGPMTTIDVANLLSIERPLAGSVMRRLHSRNAVDKNVDGLNISWSLPKGGAAKPPVAATAPSKVKSPRKSRKAKKRGRVSPFVRFGGFVVRMFDGCLRVIGLQRIGGSAE